MTIREAQTSGKAPCPRRQHAAAFLEDAVYVYGGLDGSFQCLGDLHSLRVQGGEPYVWTEVMFSGPTPGPRHSMSLNAVQQKLLLIGGSDNNLKNYADFLLIDIIKRPNPSDSTAQPQLEAHCTPLKPEGGKKFLEGKHERGRSESIRAKENLATAVVEDSPSGTASILITGLYWVVNEDFGCI